MFAGRARVWERQLCLGRDTENSCWLLCHCKHGVNPATLGFARGRERQAGPAHHGLRGVGEGQLFRECASLLRLGQRWGAGMIQRPFLSPWPLGVGGLSRQFLPCNICGTSGQFVNLSGWTSQQRHVPVRCSSLVSGGPIYLCIRVTWVGPIKHSDTQNS